MKFNLEHSRFAFELVGVFFGERNIYVELIADVFADYLLLKAGNETARAELERIALGFAAVKRFAVNEALEVYRYGVAVLRRSVVNIDKTCLLFLIIRKFFRNVRFGNFNGFLGQFKTLVTLYLYLGFNRNGRFEAETVLADFENLDIGSVNRLYLCFFNSSLVRFGINFFHRVVVENSGAVHSLNHFSRRFALAEAGNVEFFYILSVRFFNSRFKLVCGNADFEFNDIFFFVGNFFKFHVDLVSYFFTFTGIIAYLIYKSNSKYI